MANYPTSLDSLVNPSSSDTTTAVDHAAQHANANDAIEALEAKLGIGASVAATNKLLRGTGAGASAWDKDAPTGTIVGTTDSQTLTNKTLTSPTINTAIINNPTLNTNTISEFTAAAGVTIDGVLLKDGVLGSNTVPTAAIQTDAVTATKLDWAATGADAGIWWEELGRATLGAAGDTLTISGLPVRKYLHVRFELIATGACSSTMRFNNDSAANYAHRYAADGAFGTGTSVTGLASWGHTNTPLQGTADIINVASRVKGILVDGVQGDTAAGTVPGYVKFWGKWVNTSNPITQINFVNSGAGDYAIGSSIVVLGHD